MIVVDANVLLYAVDEDADHHRASNTWLDRALNGHDTVGLSWIVLLAFVRLSTKIGLYPTPLTPDEAIDQVDVWVTSPGARVLHPGAGHHRALAAVLRPLGTGGNLVNDAHLAALAIEHRASVVSYDADFARFEGVRCRRPDDLL